MTLGAQLPRANRRQTVTDEFLGIFERRVIRRDFDLREDRHHIAYVARFAERVLERLLQHVADPASGRRDEHS